MLRVLSLLSIAAVSCTDPTPKQWENTFFMTFNETTSILSKHSNSGSYYYDYTNKRQRIDRDNGGNDRYCSSAHGGTTPCTHLVVNSKRYLVYPDQKYCCMCCTDASGCGVVAPTWVNNAPFVATTTYNNLAVNEWNQKGLQSNFYYETIDTKIPVAIDQSPNDLMVFDTTTYSTKPLDDSLFDIPSYCLSNGKDNKCGLFTVCTVALK